MAPTFILESIEGIKESLTNYCKLQHWRFLQFRSPTQKPPILLTIDTLMRYFGLRLPLGTRIRRRAALRSFLADGVMRNFAPLLFVSAEDHLSSRGLKHTGYRRLDGFSDHLSGVIDNHHRAVIQVGNTLIEFFSLFQDKDFHGFT